MHNEYQLGPTDQRPPDAVATDQRPPDAVEHRLSGADSAPDTHLKIDLTLSVLESFVTISEELHFRRAADRLHMSEPAISRQLTRLERTLGFPLLARTSRRVALTPAGTAFLRRVKHALRAIELGHGEGARAHAGREGVLRIGYRPANAVWLVPAVIRVHARKHPGVSMTLIEMDEDLIGQAVGAGQVDVSFSVGRRADSGLVQEMLYEEPFAVALPTGHRLARRERLAQADLRGEDFVIWSRPHPEFDRDPVSVAFRQASLEARIAMEAWDPHTVLNLVADGLGISVMAYDYRHLGIPGVKLVPLKGPAVGIFAVRGEESSVLTDRFMDTVREVLAAHQAGRTADQM